MEAKAKKFSLREDKKERNLKILVERLNKWEELLSQVPSAYAETVVGRSWYLPYSYGEASLSPSCWLYWMQISRLHYHHKLLPFLIN